MTNIVEYTGFELLIVQLPQGCRVEVTSPPTIYIPHHLRQVIRQEEEDAIAEAKSIVDYLKG
jgi:hypothetical protein